jgi:hypothetical protein
MVVEEFERPLASRVVDLLESLRFVGRDGLPLEDPMLVFQALQKLFGLE